MDIFNSDGSPDTAIKPEDDDKTFKEYQYSASDLAPFTAFQLKIVMKGTNSDLSTKNKRFKRNCFGSLIVCQHLKFKVIHI